MNKNKLLIDIAINAMNSYIRVYKVGITDEDQYKQHRHIIESSIDLANRMITELEKQGLINE